MLVMMVGYHTKWRQPALRNGQNVLLERVTCGLIMTGTVLWNQLMEIFCDPIVWQLNVTLSDSVTFWSESGVVIVGGSVTEARSIH